MAAVVTIQLGSAGSKGNKVEHGRHSSSFRNTRQLALGIVVCLTLMVMLYNLARSRTTHGGGIKAVLPDAVASQHETAEHPVPQSAVAAEDGPSVAILNQEVFHYEVVAGFMHAVSTLVAGNDMAVYLQSHNWMGNDSSMGFRDLVRPLKHTIRELPCSFQRHKVLIFISPEYNVSFVQQAIQAAQPQEVLLVMHNGDSPHLDQLMAVHPRAHIITLAPHVRAFLLRRQRQSPPPLHRALASGTWMLPVWPWTAAQPCGDDQLRGCLSGFTIQGKINRHKRNYTHVFEQLDHARTLCSEKTDCHESMEQLKVQLLGAAWTSLHIPPEVTPAVSRLNKLRFHSFYQHVYKSLALIPALGQGTYLDRKFSSTLLTSLVTGVPMVTDRTMLRVYPFLTPEHVLLQSSDTTLADMMLKVVQHSSEQLASTRLALLQLRDSLNHDAAAKLRDVLTPYLPQTDPTSATPTPMSATAAGSSDSEPQLAPYLPNTDQTLAIATPIPATAAGSNVESE